MVSVAGVILFTLLLLVLYMISAGFAAAMAVLASLYVVTAVPVRIQATVWQLESSAGTVADIFIVTGSLQQIGIEWRISRPCPGVGYFASLVKKVSAHPLESVIVTL
jgi:hypothetical protein